MTMSVPTLMSVSVATKLTCLLIYIICMVGVKQYALVTTRYVPQYSCLCRNHAQWEQQWRPRRSFQVQCFCVEFLHFIGICWLLSVSICSFLTIARDRTVSYCIFISLSVSWYISSAQIYPCIGTTMNRFTPKAWYSMPVTGTIIMKQKLS